MKRNTCYRKGKEKKGKEKNNHPGDGMGTNQMRGWLDGWGGVEKFIIACGINVSAIMSILCGRSRRAAAVGGGRG